MKIGVPKETAPDERRVALVPEIVAKLSQAGFDVIVEPGAGEVPPSRTMRFARPGRLLAIPGTPSSSPRCASRPPTRSIVSMRDRS